MNCPYTVDSRFCDAKGHVLVRFRKALTIGAAEEMMTDTALIKKLQLKPGMRMLFLNAPADQRDR